MFKKGLTLRYNAGNLLFPALFSFRPEVTISAFAAFRRRFRVGGVAVHTDGLV